MKQILQNLKTGVLEVAEVPRPIAGPGQLLIQSRCTLISAGTERMLVSFAQSSLLGKAKQQPDKVKQVMDKIKTDGLLPTLNTVFSRLDEPMPMGYCNCGTVLEVGQGIEDFKIGDRVASNGAHAEIVCVPKNLCAKVPDNVSDEDAAFTVLASIGLQGIRLLNPTFGETMVVSGLGLIGLVCVQILRNSGCRVIGIDINADRLKLAETFGAEVINAANGADVVASALARTNGMGVDGVLITASAKDDSIVHQSAQMCRKRGRIVLIGVVNLNLNRADFYNKELTFQVSCSYGPGRYDAQYEQKGQDYPIGFVRWTEQRNFEAILQNISSGTLNVSSLISDRIPQAEATKAYKLVTDDPSKMGLILTYPAETISSGKTIAVRAPAVQSTKTVVAGLIGAGNFATLILLPAIRGANIRLKTIADINPVAGAHAGRKFGFENVTSDYQEILNDSDINTVFITTRHNLHAKMVIEAIRAGKHVHVEKPLCMNAEELGRIKEAHEAAKDRQLLVGFNRRFSPHAEKIHSLVSSRNSPLCMVWLINAGHIPSNIWVQDKAVGGGRIIGEGCHWMDFMRYVAGESIVSVSATMVGSSPDGGVCDDKISITLKFSGGSVGTLHYFANGSKSYPKETFELFCEGKILSLDNFRKLTGYGWSNFGKMKLFSQDKGHKSQFNRFIERIRTGGDPLIPFEDIENATLASFAAMESAAGAGVIEV
ncbi:MAG: bi-domain-containing oxidoreductase [Sedimentisphaerales bacterium]|jgi:predicted dehydrogenase/NADPH:quinone reductase-like Zn-dependent oxidoreductase